MKKILIVCAFALSTSFVNAQSLSSFVIGSAGENFSSAAGSLTWTLGEVLTENYQQSLGSFTQGFQQADGPIVTGLENTREQEFVVYPNPAKDFFNLIINRNGTYQIELFDLQGRKFVQEQARVDSGTQTHLINLPEFKVGMYLLRVTNTSTVKNFNFKIEHY